MSEWIATRYQRQNRWSLWHKITATEDETRITACGVRIRPNRTAITSADKPPDTAPVCYHCADHAEREAEG
jgi:hypothetical protein